MIIKLKTQNGILLFFIPGFIFALLCGIVFEFNSTVLIAIPVVAISSIFLFSRGKDYRPYLYVLLCMTLISLLYSYFYHTLIGIYFSSPEIVHVLGPVGLAGFGILLFFHGQHHNTEHNLEHAPGISIKAIIGVGIVVGICGLWWLIIIFFAYMRFLYWPLFWIISLLSSLCALGIGIFSVLLAGNLKKNLLYGSTQKKPSLPLHLDIVFFRRITGIIVLCTGFLCMVYQTGLFPLIGM